MSTYIQYQGTTTNDTQTELFIDGIPGQRKLISSNKSISFWGNIVARNSTPDASKHWRFAGLIKNQSGSVSIVDVIDKIIIAQDSGASTWDIDWQADDTNDALVLKATGQAGTTIYWEAKLYIIEQ